MTTRTDRFWSGAPDTFTASYTNDRNSAWTYNTSGDVVNDTMQHQFNAAGHQTATIGTDFTIEQIYDGVGQPAERIENRPNFSDTMYYLRSTVLGGRVVTELNAQGARKNSYVFINGEETWRGDGSTGNLLLTLHNPVTGINGFSQLDPLGGYVGFDDPYQQNPNPDYDWLKGPTDFFVGDGNPFDRGSGCTWNQLPIPCGYAAMLLEHGAAVLAPLDSVIAVRYRGEWVLAEWQAYADGYQGYVPSTASYSGEGHITSINPPKLFGRGSLAGDTDFSQLNGSNDPEVALRQSTVDLPAGHLSLQRVFALIDPCVNAVVNATPTSMRDAAWESVPLLLQNANAAGLTTAQTSYVLATVRHESHFGQLMEETWGPTRQQLGYEGRTDLGNTQPGDGYRFRGRGYVQITGRLNYQDWTDRLGSDLVSNPDLATDPEIAASITVLGMADGTFTKGGRSLDRYINQSRTDFYNARRIVNGDVRKNGARIGRYARRYLRVLERNGC